MSENLNITNADKVELLIDFLKLENTAGEEGVL